MAETPSPMGVTGAPGDNGATGIDRAGLRVDFWLFVVMLALAIVGVAVSQVDTAGSWHYWVLLVLLYAGISVARAWLQARRHGLPVWPMIRAQVLHWAGTLVVIKIILLFEVTGIANRGPASDLSLLVLALSCYLAGVHFNWTFMLLGGVLAVIAVALGYLDQLSVFALILPLAALAVWIAFKHKFAPGP